ncbi:MAG: hypothetical protein ABI425_05670 [Patescibacteria group bacterium]
MSDKEPTQNQPPQKDLDQQIEKEMAIIDQLLAKLKFFEETNPPNDNVDRAFACIDEVIDQKQTEYRQKLIDNKVLVTYHGSLQFNDPRNLDLDLVFTAVDESSLALVNNTIDKLEAECEQIDNWPTLGNNQGHCDTNFNRFSIEQVEIDLKRMSIENKVIDPEYDFIDLYVGILLSSKVLFPEQEVLFEIFQQKAKSYLHQSTVLRKAITELLEDILKTRQERKRAKNS